MTEQYRVAIVGSREFSSELLVRAYVRALPKTYMVVSGGARGVDSWAVDEARKRGLQTCVYPADWNRYGKPAGMIRNRTIVDNCDWLVAFYDGKSRGTAHTIGLAQRGLVPHAIIQRAPTGDWDIDSTEEPSNLFLDRVGKEGH